MANTEDNRNLEPLFKVPVGPSDKRYHWSSAGTTGGASCQLCGTEWPEEDQNSDGISLVWLNGRQIVVECCGRYIDALYEQLGELFTTRFLNDFADDPTASEFMFLRIVLDGTLRKAVKKLDLTRKEVEPLAEQASKIAKLPK